MNQTSLILRKEIKDIFEHRLMLSTNYNTEIEDISVYPEHLYAIISLVRKQDWIWMGDLVIVANLAII